MTLLLPAWLAVAGLVLVVLALHVRTRKRVEVSSILLWRMIAQFATPSRTVKRPPITLLLILQLLIVLLATFALARPLLGPAPVPHHRVYLLDASASMRATDERPSRFDDAVDLIRREAETLPEGNRLSVVLVGPSSSLAIARQSLGDGIVPILDQLTPTDGVADWAGAMALLPSIVRADEETDIVAVTDGADLAVNGLAYDGVPMARFVVASDAARNLAVQARAEAAAPGTWRISGSIEGRFAEPIALRVRFLPADGRTWLDWTEVAIPPTGEAATPFAFDLDLPEPGAVEVTVPADAGPADNAAFVLINEESSGQRVLRVGPDNPPLDAALGAIDGVTVFASPTLPPDAASYDLVIVDGVTVPGRPATNVLWLGAGHPATGDAPIGVGPVEASRWRADHPLSVDIDWGSFLPQAALLVPSLPGADVVVESGRAPLLQDRLTETGREIWLAADLSGDPWLRSPAFPLFLRNVADAVGITAAAAGATCIAGEPCRVPSRDAGGPLHALADGAETIPVDGVFVPLRAGVYETDDGRARVAVNATTAEADLAPALETTARRLPTSNWARELWWWLLAAMLVLLVVEGILAGRGAERFLRAEALAPSNPQSRRYRVLLFLRVAAVMLTVLAVLNVGLPSRQRSEDVVVVASDSTIGELRLDTLDAAGGARIGLVALDDLPRVAGDLDEGARFPATAGDPVGLNLEDALLLAAAMLPGDRPGRIVLAADGRETAGNAERAIATLRRRGIAVDGAAESALPEGEVLVAELDVPATVQIGDTFPLRASIVAAEPMTATVEVRRDGNPIVTQEVALVAGSNRVEATIANVGEGRSTFEVLVSAAGDVVAENNRATALVDASPAPRIAILTPDSSWGYYLADALTIQGLTAEVVLPRDAPWDLEGWLAYDLVVTMNLPALSLDTVQQDLLETAVHDHGRGLLLLGGENAFGPGGYYQTAFERMSPLSSRAPRDAPASAIIFVLDRSGSMQAAAAGGSRLEIAKIATNHAIGLLQDNTEVGVIAFDSAAHVIAPLRPKDQSLGVADAIGAMVAGGGTAMFPALQEAIAQIEQSDAAVRHIVLLSDGLAEPADFYPILQRARSANLTISTVAIGQGADAALLRQIANIGGGAFSITEDFSALPAIFAREALLLAGSPVRNRLTPVIWIEPTPPFLAGVGEIPPVRSFVVTSAQPGADVHLTVEDEDGTVVPLLASWRYGAGQVLAFATHGAGPGTRDWIGAADFPRFWAQLVRHFLPDAEGPGLHVQLTPTGSRLLVVADFVGGDGAAVTGRSLLATVDGPAGSAGIVLTERDDGRYVGEADAAAEGIYTVTVAGEEAAVTAAIAVPYPAILDFSRADLDLVPFIAAATGGATFDAEAPLFTAPAEWIARPGWWLWAIFALVLFMIDLGIRNMPRLFGLAGRRRGTGSGFFAGGAEPAP